MTESEHLVEEHIAKHGYTRCPTAVLAPTQGVDIDPADALAHMRRAPIKLADPRKRQLTKPQKPKEPRKPAKVHSKGLSRATECTQAFDGRKYEPSPEELLNLRQQGLSFPQIARRFDRPGQRKCHHSTVLWWFTRFGLSKERYVKRPDGKFVPESELTI